jgi:selenocysteine lyase/cysteine desulfurase
MSAVFTSPLDLDHVRAQFPELQRVTYLNVGTYGLVPECALQKELEAVAAFDRGGQACKVELGGIQERVRQRVAAMLGAGPEEIAITRNATDGNNLVLAGLDWKPGDEIISTDEEHPSLQHPLLYLQKTKGLKVHWLPISHDADEMVGRIAAAASPRTRLIAMSHVPCETGTRLPAKEIAKWAAERGILSHFDGAQCVGAVRIDVKDIGCDFYALNGHKWTCGPKGTGFFYARKERIEDLKPAHVGAGSLEKADQAAGIAEPWPDGRRFEFGTRCWSILAGYDATMDWFESLGWDNVYEHVAHLSDYLKSEILARPHLKLLTPVAIEHSSGLVVFAMPGRDPEAAASEVRDKWQIYTRMVLGGTGIRISTAHFNSREDIDLLLRHMDEFCESHPSSAGKDGS